MTKGPAQNAGHCADSAKSRSSCALLARVPSCWLLIALASISLVIGAIGIMNVMLASVMQRTNEIGVRMAVGATAGAVRLQFLGEAVLLSLLGGALGLPLSLAGSFLIAGMLGWPISISWKAAALAVICSGGVGMVAGFYPAWRASRLDPVVALRNEYG